MAAARSDLPKIKLPATNTLAPATRTRGLVSGSIPPSTESSQWGFFAWIKALVSRILSNWSDMNTWLPKPGSTVMMRTMSKSAI